MSELSALAGSEGYEACFDVVEVTGLEPVTPCLQSRCSTS